MANQVRETKAGRAISAYIVLDKKGAHVATINAHYGAGGRVSVDVWNIGGAAIRSFETARKTGRVSEKALAALAEKAPDYYEEQTEREEWAARDMFGLQQSSAGGYGYDKFAAALAGLIIDGHTIANHCGQVPEDEKKRAGLMRSYIKSVESGAPAAGKEWREKAARIGCHFTNWTTCGNFERWSSLYFEHGLSRLECFGYRVIQAI